MYQAGGPLAMKADWREAMAEGSLRAAVTEAGIPVNSEASDAGGCS